MKTVPKIVRAKTMAAQGDVLLRRVDKMPEGLKPAGDNIVTHSETGHHHVAVPEFAGGEFQIYNTTDPLVSYLTTREPVQIVHQREWDTHETLLLDTDGDGGEVIWEIRRQKEWAPEGWRQVAD